MRERRQYTRQREAVTDVGEGRSDVVAYYGRHSQKRTSGWDTSPAVTGIGSMDIQGTCRIRLGNPTVVGTGSNVQCRHTKGLTAYQPLD
jgi:hypothetical protein